MGPIFYPYDENSYIMAQHIKTNIKFCKGLDNSDSRVYGFVTKVDGSWRGCYGDDNTKKKIVFVDTALEKSIVPGKLYRCVLTPMKSQQGFVAISAVLVGFPGVVRAMCGNGNFKVTVQFGNRLITYDPSSDDPRKNDIQVVARHLQQRIDLKNAYAVAENFVDNAVLIKRLYDQHHKNLTQI